MGNIIDLRRGYETPSKIRSLLKRFVSLFKHKKKKPEYTPWGEKVKSEPKKSNPTSFKVWVSNTLGGISRRASQFFQPPKSKIHIKWLLKSKRILSGILCFIYLIAFFTSLPNPISLMFFATFFIFLDYLWKTRRIDWVKD